jgi:hypothetical protein
MAVQALPLLFQAQSQPMLVVEAAAMLTMAALKVQAVLAAVQMAGETQRLVEQQTQAVVVVAQVTAIQAAQAVQALSFFATPAQFNILLVAQ